MKRIIGLLATTTLLAAGRGSRPGTPHASFCADRPRQGLAALRAGRGDASRPNWAWQTGAWSRGGGTSTDDLFLRGDRATHGPGLHGRGPGPAGRRHERIRDKDRVSGAVSTVDGVAGREPGAALVAGRTPAATASRSPCSRSSPRPVGAEGIGDDAWQGRGDRSGLVAAETPNWSLALSPELDARAGRRTGRAATSASAARSGVGRSIGPVALGVELVGPTATRTPSGHVTSASFDLTRRLDAGLGQGPASWTASAYVGFEP